MKTRIFALALCATALAACDARAGTEEGQTLSTDAAAKTADKPDFAGVSFRMKKSDFQREGYVCKDNTKDGITLTNCKNFDIKASVFGQDVKGVSVGFREGADTPFRIATELPVEYANPAKRNAFTSRISEYYTSLSDQDMDSEAVELRRWKRSDGAMLQLTAIKGIPGMIQPSITIQMFDAGDSSSGK